MLGTARSKRKEEGRREGEKGRDRDKRQRQTDVIIIHKGMDSSHPGKSTGFLTRNISKKEGGR